MLKANFQESSPILKKSKATILASESVDNCEVAENL